MKKLIIFACVIAGLAIVLLGWIAGLFNDWSR